MSELDARKGTILRAVVVEYVLSAEPVGSEAIVQKYDLGVRSATVRNEMADLLDRGLLAQPHTSAGRIPSDRGYRYYVDRLVVEREVDPSLKARLADATRRGDALDDVLRETVRHLARATQLLGVGTILREKDTKIRTVVVSAMGPGQALLVLAFSNGQVENRMIELPAVSTLDDLGRANAALAAALLDKTLSGATRGRVPTADGHPTTETILGSVWPVLRSIARERSRGAVITEGEEYMFAQPEFRRDLGLLTDLLRELTDGDVLYDAVAQPDATGNVTIGQENRHESLHQLSIVRRAFRIGPDEAGVVAVVGPTRMPYAHGIPLVELTAKALSDSLTRLLA